MKTIQTLSLALLAVFAPIQSVLLTVLALILADVITGVLAARARKEKIVSSGLRRSVVKLLVYEIAIMLGFVTESFLTGDLVPICKIISTYVGLTELKSIFENLNAISGGSLLKSIIEKLGNTKEIK